MNLRKRDMIFRNLRRIAHDHVPYPFDCAGSIPLLLKPRQAPSMRVKARNDIGKTVAVDVIYEDVGAPGFCNHLLRLAAFAFGIVGCDIDTGAERSAMEFPECFSSCRRLFPPTGSIKDIDAAIAVDVSIAKAMRSPQVLFRDSVKRPWLGRIRPVRLRIADLALSGHDQFGPPVSIDVHELARFGSIVRYDNELVPVAVFATWIDIENVVMIGRGMAIVEQIQPAIAVEVVGIGLENI